MELAWPAVDYYLEAASVTVASPMRIDRVAGLDRATRSADQFPVIRRCGECIGRQRATCQFVHRTILASTPTLKAGDSYGAAR